MSNPTNLSPIEEAELAASRADRDSPIAIRANRGRLSRLVILEARAGITSDDTNTALVEMANALSVIATDPGTIAYLTEHDPRALQQVRDAVGMSDYSGAAPEAEAEAEELEAGYEAEHLAEVYAEAGSGARSLGFDTDSCYQSASEAVADARRRAGR